MAQSSIFRSPLREIRVHFLLMVFAFWWTENQFGSSGGIQLLLSRYKPHRPVFLFSTVRSVTGPCHIAMRLPHLSFCRCQ